MKLNLKKGLAAFLTVLMMLQFIPMTLLNALAEDFQTFYFQIDGKMYYEVNFVDHDNTTIVTQLVAEGTAAIPPEAPTREATAAEGDVAWEFQSWVSDPAGVSMTGITQDVVFRATYIKLEMTPFTVNYTLTPVDPTVVLPPSVIKYFRVGDTANVSIASPAVPGYKPDKDPVTYNGVMGQNPSLETVTVTYEKQPDLNYTVQHWFEADDAVANNLDPVPGTAGQFTLDSSLDDSGTVAYDGTVALTDKATAGYTMITQVQEPQTTDNKVYDVYYKKNRYTLTYDSNGTGASVPAPVSIKYGNSIVLPATNPTRTGFTFAGWFPNADGSGTQYTASDRMPANDTKIFGKWAGTTVSYKLVNWVEKANLDPDATVEPTPENMDDYIYHSEKSLTGVAGTTVAQSVITANKASIVTSGSTTAAYNNIPYAEYQAYDSTTEIEGDGTTVINVYYKRIVFTYTFNPSGTATIYTTSSSGSEGSGASGSVIGRFPGLAEGASKSYKFKYEQYLLNFADPDNSWPYPSSGNDPEYRLSSTSYGSHLFRNWNIPTGYPINRRDILTAEMLPSSGTTLTVGPGAVTTVNAYTAYTYDLWYFEKLLGQTATPHIYNTAGSRTVSSVVTIPDGIPGYSRDIVGTTGHNNTLNILGCTFITCNHSVNTFKYPSTLAGKNIAIYEVYMKRNRVSITFDRNTSASVTDVPSVPTATDVMYGETYPWWPAATRNVLDNNGAKSYVPGVSPTYTDASGVTWIFENWHLYPQEVEVVTLNNAMTAPAQSITYYAHWKPVDVTVTFTVDGSQYHQQTLPAYSRLFDALPANPAKAGYTFNGWYNGGVRYDGSFVLRSNITLDANLTPKPTAYTVKYVDGSNADIRVARRVTGKVVDDVILIPADETAPHIAGYTLVNTTPSGGSLTLVENENNNVITFHYKKFDGYTYNIHYVKESDGTDVFPPVLNQNTWAEQQVVWAKKDTSQVYYPVDGAGIAQEYQTVTMDPDGGVIDVVFTYRAYAVVTYTERNVLYGGPHNGEIVYSDSTKTAKIGQTVMHSKTNTTEVFGIDNKNYRYSSTVAGSLNSATIETESQQLVLTRYYVLECTVLFLESTGGTISGTREQWVPYGSPWSLVTPPTPKANTGYYFSGWSAAFPATITEDVTFTANFTAQTPLTITANSSTVTYDASQKQVTGFGYTGDTGLTITGVTTSDPTGTTVGTYPNTIEKTADFKIVKGGVDVTERYTVTLAPGNLVISKRPLVVTGVTESVDYTGQPQQTHFTPTTAPVTGHTITVANMVTYIAPGTYNAPVNAANVKVWAGTTDVTDNYIITGNPGQFTINALPDGKKLSIVLQAGDTARDYTGQTINVEVGVTVTSGMPANGTLVDAKATSSGLNPDNYPTVIQAGYKIMVDNFFDVTSNYVPVENKGTFTINELTGDKRIPMTVTANNAQREYTGNTITVTDAGYTTTLTPVAPLTLLVTTSGTGLLPDTYDIDVTSVNVMNGAVNLTNNYNITPVKGKLTIIPPTTKIALTLTPVNQTVEYTGQVQYADANGAVTQSPQLPSAVTLTTQLAGSGLATGDYALTISSYKLMVGTTDVTDYYNVTTNPGKFIINPAANPFEITLTPAKQTKAYTGSVVHADATGAVNLTAGTLPSGYVLQTSLTGSGTVPGNYDITIDDGFKIFVGGVDVTSSYTVTRAKGVLEITQATGGEKLDVTLKPDTQTKPYTGSLINADTNGPVTATPALPTGATLEKTLVGSGTVPGNYDVDIQAGYKIWHGGVDVTASYNVTLETGVLVIRQATGGERLDVTLKPDTQTKPYTGSLINADVDGPVTATPALPTGATLEKTLLGSGTVPGQYTITIQSGYKIWHDGVDVTASYNVNPQTGILEITQATTKIAVSLKPDRQTKAYTGSLINADANGPVTATPALPTGATLEKTLLGSGTVPGEYTISIQNGYKIWHGGVDVTASYAVTLQTGILEITQATNKIAVTLKPDTQTVPFTGTTITANASGTVTASPTLPSGASAVTKIEGSGVVPGTYVTTINADRKIMHDGVDVTDSYTITLNPGVLEITKLTGNDRIKLEVTADSKQEEYTGALITVNVGGTVTQGTLPTGPSGYTLTVNATGSGLIPGNYDITFGANDYTIVYNGSTGGNPADVTSNYDVDRVKGNLKIVNSNAIKLYITADSVDIPFTGETQNITASGAVTSGTTPLASGLTLVVESKGSGRVPGSYDMKVTSVQVLTASNEDVTLNYNVIDTDGVLKIWELGTPTHPEWKKIDLYVTLPNDAYDYTGNLITTTVDGVLNTWSQDINSTITNGTALPTGVDLTVKGYSEGTVPNTYPITQQGTETLKIGNVDVTSNYTLHLTNGELTIRKLTGANRIALTVTPDNKTVPFNGHLQQFTGLPVSYTPTAALTSNLTLTATGAANGFAPDNYVIVLEATPIIRWGTADVTENYDITEGKGVLTITPLTGTDRIPLTVKANDHADWYTGETVTTPANIGGAITSGAIDSTLTLDVAASGNGILPDTYDILISSVKILLGTVDLASNYNITPVAGTLTIKPRNATNLIPLDVHVNDETLPFTGTTQWVNQAGASNGFVDSSVTGNDLPSYLTLTAIASGSGVQVGTYDILFDQTKTTIKHGAIDLTSNYDITHHDATLTIRALNPGEKFALAVKVVDQTRTYTGNPILVMVSDVSYASGFNPADIGATITVHAQGTGTVPGGYDITYTPNTVQIMLGSVDITSNFDVTVNKGTLTINQATGADRIPITLTPDDQTYGYTGSAINVNANGAVTEIPVLPTGATLTATLSGSATVPGTYVGAITINAGYRIMHTDGGVTKDVTDSYNVTPGKGNLIITQATTPINVTLKPDTQTKNFTGAPITADANGPVTATPALPTGATLNRTLSSSAVTLPGTYANAITIDPGYQIMHGGVDVTASFNPTLQPGDLIIRSVAGGIAITVGAVDPAPVKYNGTQQGFTGRVADPASTVTVTSPAGVTLPAGVQINIDVDLYRTNAGTYPYTFTPAQVKITVGGQDITENYRITTLPGTMVINKLDLHADLTAGNPLSTSYVYGDPIPVPGATYTVRHPDTAIAFNGVGDSLHYEVVQEQNNLNVGTGYTFIPALVGDYPNYDTTDVLCHPSTGTFEITTAPLMITAWNSDMAYGTGVLDRSGYDVTGLKYNDTRASIGLGITVGHNSPANDPISSSFDVELTQTGSPSNYTVTLVNNTGTIYGQVFYHTNYPNGADEVRFDGVKYFSQNDTVNPANAGDLGMLREDLRFLEWTTDAAGQNPYTPTAIGPTSIDLYAQWKQMYRLEIAHITDDYDLVGPTWIIWMDDGSMYKFVALENPMYDVLRVEYEVDGVLYTFPMDNGREAFILMPKAAVNATIYYVLKDGAMGGGLGDEEGLLTDQQAYEERMQGYFALWGYDIPLSGIGSKNVGDCFE